MTEMPPANAAIPKDPPRSAWGLYLIAADKLVKGLLLIVLGLGLLRMVHADLQETVKEWAHHLHVAPGNKFLQEALAKLLNVTPGEVRAAGIGSLLYAGLYLVEGVGLLFKQRWAEWVVVVSTGVFIPVEVYEIILSASEEAWRGVAWKVAALAINGVILAYLIRLLGRQHREDERREVSKIIENH